MADRLKHLQRVEAVQKQMVRLAEVRLVAAERTCRALAEAKERLDSYVVTEGALGVPLAKAALKSLHTLDRRRQTAERTRTAGEAALKSAKQREKAIEGVRKTAAVTARRAEDDRALSDVIESWLAGGRDSLR